MFLQRLKTIAKRNQKSRRLCLFYSSHFYIFFVCSFSIWFYKMALNTMKYPLAQTAKRGFAAQAAIRPVENSAPEMNCSVLPNKLMLNTLDLCGPLSRVSVVFRVGPRHETHRTSGIVHTIRIMAGFGTERCSGFAVWKHVQYNGGHLYCTGDRETTGFHLVAPRSKIADSLKFLGLVAAEPAFKPWEIKDNVHRLKYEIGGLSPQVKVIDNLHAAAYRTGLGNSLFIQKDLIGSYSSEALRSFYKEGFTANKASVTAINVSQHEMLEFAKNLDLTANELPEGNSKFFGGEIRHNVDSYFAHVAIASPGGSMKDIKEALIYCVLQHALGVRPNVTWGGSPSPLYKAVYSTAPEAGASCISASYSDSGLFGFLISSFAENAECAVKAAMKVLKSGSVSEADFNRAKAMVRGNVLMNSEKSENIVEDMSVQSLMSGIVVPAPVLADAVDKITLADVNNAAQKVACGPFALSAYGNLHKVPYLDELR